MTAPGPRVLIVGGGTAGLTVASLLLKQRPGLAITLLEPSGDHWYQPGWTLVGGGLLDLKQTRRDEAGLIPKGCRWIQAAAVAFDPDRNLVHCSDDRSLSYDALVLATGLQCRWERIAGLAEALGSQGICSNYAGPGAAYTWETIQAFQGGTAIFTVPDTPIKCGGAPQKVMYLADDHFKAQSGVGVNSRVIFCTAGESLFAVPAYARSLHQVIQRRGIEVRLRHNLREVRADAKVAIFEVSEPDGTTRTEAIPFAMLHAVPPMTAPEPVAASPLAGPEPGGWVEVDPLSTQHRRYANVFAAGDCASLPTSRTAGSARQAAAVLVQNLLALLDGQPLLARYDGYTVCPLITGYGKVLLAEFDYTLEPVSSLLVDPTRERWSFWLLKTRLLPWIYWNRVLKGERHEGDFLKPLAPLAHLLGLDYRPAADLENWQKGTSSSCS